MEKAVVLTDTILPPGRDISHEQALAASDSVMSSTELEGRYLHWWLTTIDALAGWPIWLIGGIALLAVGGVTGLWWLLVGGWEVFYLALALTLFTLADLLILTNLPRWRISFGPVVPQLFNLACPRLAVAALAAPVASWLGMAPALMGVLLINLVAWLALVWGAVLEPQRLGLSHLSLTGLWWPPDMPPLCLLQVSDLHVERFGRRERRLLQLVRTIAPDLIVLTGDYLNLSCVNDPVAHADARRVLAALCPDGEERPPAGAYAVLGSPPVDRNSAPLFDGLPIRLLRDEVATIDLPAPEAGGQPRRLALLGLDCSHDLKWDAERLAALVTQAPPDAFRLLLYHSPELMPVAHELDINLYLCGHTHGGQVRMPLYGALLTSSKLGKRFEMGHYRLEDTHLYVSRGVGMEGMGAPRVRFLCPPEITLFSLRGD